MYQLSDKVLFEHECFRINASNVTLDLGGRTLAHNPVGDRNEPIDFSVVEELDMCGQSATQNRTCSENGSCEYFLPEEKEKYGLRIKENCNFEFTFNGK